MRPKIVHIGINVHEVRPLRLCAANKKQPKQTFVCANAIKKCAVLQVDMLPKTF